MRGWTERELETLTENYGKRSIEWLTCNLDRSESAIKNKVARLKLGRWYHNLEEISFNQLAEALNVSNNTLSNWGVNYGLPVKQRRTFDTKFKIVDLDDFWKWAERNKHMIEFDKIDKHILGAEPKWVEEARNQAFKTVHGIGKSYKKTQWSEDDDVYLKHLLEQHKYTYPEISEKLSRSHGAIKRRMHDLRIKERPIYLDNHKKYSSDEIDFIFEMLDKGSGFSTIAKELKRSEAGVRGKIERLGYKFENRVPVKVKGGEEE